MDDNWRFGNTIMPVSSLSLSRTHRNFTDHLKNFELGTITETNPSNGLYRYTFADNASPYSWSEVAQAQAFGDPIKFGINVSYQQLNNTTGAYNHYTNTYHYGLFTGIQFPKTDSVSLLGNTYSLLPSGRNTETSGTFANYLGDTSYGGAAWYTYGPSNPRFYSNNPITVNTKDRYVEINWNQIALNETTYTTTLRAFGRVANGKLKIIFQPYVYFDFLSYPDFAVYYGKPRYYNTTVSGSNLANLLSSPPGNPTNFVNNASARSFSWTHSPGNAVYFYINLWKWDGSNWFNVRHGFLSDGYVAWQQGFSIYNFNTLYEPIWNRYTVPSSDGSGWYYIYVYQYDGYYDSWSPGVYSDQMFLS